MNLDRAIEILADSAFRGVTTFNQDFTDAEKLGIEAIKRIQAYRRHNPFINPSPLPFETED